MLFTVLELLKKNPGKIFLHFFLDRVMGFRYISIMMNMENKGTLAMTKKTVEDYRNEYRALILEAGRRFGWDADTLKANAAHLVPCHRRPGEAAGHDWVGAAREAMEVEDESRNS